MKLKQRLKLLTLPLLAALLVSSCIPGANKGSSTKADCKPGFNFDSVRRRCLASTTPQEAPVGTTTSASLAENSGANTVAITYTDFHNDPALSCTILSFNEGINDTVPTCSCVTGICSANITVDSNFSGITDFSYVVTDNDGVSDQVLVTVNVIPINNPPVASVGGVSTSEGVASNFNFSALVTDPDGDIPTISILTQPELGTVTPTIGNALTTFTFTPNANENDQDFLGSGEIAGMRYLIDPDFNSATASLTVRYVPSATLSLGSLIPNLLTVFIVDGVTTDAEVKALLDASPTIDSIVGVQYEILGSKPINIGGVTRVLNLDNGRNLPDGFTYRAIDAQDTSLTSDSSMTVQVSPIASEPVVDPLAELPRPLAPVDQDVIFTLTEDNLVQNFVLPYATTPDHFIDLLFQGVSFSRTSQSNGILSNCLGLGGAETALGGIHDLTCTFTINPDSSSDDAHSSREIGGLRYRALKKGAQGDAITIQYIDLPGLPSVTILGFPGTVLQVQFDSTVHEGKDIKAAFDAAIAAAGRPFSPADNLDIEVVMLGSSTEAAGAPLALNGGRDFAAQFVYQVNGLTTKSQTVNYDITPTPDIPGWIGLPNPGIPPVQNHAVLEDTSFQFIANRGEDPDVRDNLTYVINETGLQGDIKNCMGQDGSNAADLSCDFIPAQDFAGVTSFTYQVSDGVNLSTSATVTFTVTATQDPPVLCDYFHFNEAVECGELGCIANNTPINNVTPTKSGIIFYDQSSAACYISDTSLADKWRKLDPTLAADQQLFVPAQTVNEKEVIVIDQIRIDEGGNDAIENGETMSITAVTSSNTILIPTSNIKFFYDFDNDGDEDDITSAVPIALNDAGNSSDFKDLRMEITPIGGQVGTSTITLTFEDNTAPAPLTSTVQFLITVNPVSALHGGWSNISALSPKTNKFGQIRNPLNTCNFNRSLCNGECTGTTSPVGVVTPSTTNLLYLDTVTNKCYHLPDAATPNSANWVEVQTICNVTPSILEPGCNGLKGSCIGSGAPTITATKLNSFYFDATNNKCYRSTGTLVPSWQEYTATSSTTINWNTFSVSGTGTISGFNVYRRLGMPGSRFDYNQPINKNLIISTASSYTDNAVNSFTAPVPQTVYFYEVRPVITSGALTLPTNTTEGFKTIRLMTPPNNKTFVHRWMVNQNICQLMQATDIDPLNNYRCSYEGPGDTQLAAGTNHYDIGRDLIVDRYEAGCAYTGAPSCNTPDGSCIGIGDPVTIDADDGNVTPGDIYYDRGSGKCYRNNGPDLWAELDVSSTPIPNYNVAELPPLVHMKQARADVFCRDASLNLTDTDILGLRAATTINSQLPTRKMQIAYSQWDGTLIDTTISNNEQGLSLNVASKCNSASASGLSSSYTDTQVPGSNDLFSLPGTATSGIRSMMTGSAELGVNKGTETCSSRYGVQDAVGNVKEWVAERIDCGDLAPNRPPVEPGEQHEDVDFACTGMAASDVGLGRPWAAQVTALPSMSDDNVPGVGGDAYTVFSLDGSIGPCNDTNSDDICDDSLTSWVIDEERFFASRWVIPMGLPAHVEFPNNNPSSVVSPFLKEIGPTSGITSNQLHDDKMTINNQLLRAAEDYCGAMAAGGSYLEGTGAGVWSFEYTQCNDNTNGYLINDGFYYRAKAAGVSLRIRLNPAAAPAPLVVNNLPGNIVEVNLATDSDGNAASNSSDLLNALRTNSLVDIFVVGDVSNTPSPLSTTAIGNSPPLSRRVDIGFRCVTPVGDADYAQ